ncbi:hypothetical protein [Enterococcus phage TJE4]|uniref:Thymidylate synthase n=1 Tax=Enterococcus phage 9183 TaxID=2763102 RepID=A0A7L7STC5_9CAUD|nr:thymidylate synthase [Enterococcus phage 9183]QOC57537.1 thymidylate synthase [Enterococcus phage 9183]UVD42839.1 hypothetical protein [Enterococcus phage TJE4]
MQSFDNLNAAWAWFATKALTGKRVAGTTELNNVSFTLENINENLLTIRENFSLSYYLGEGIWYGAGSNSMEFISRFGKIWEKLSDDGVTNESAYGYILKKKYGFDQIEKMVELLSKDPNSRRAVMNINFARKNVIETNDEQCTIALQLLLRDGELNMTGIMRSNDLWTGTPYDIFYFTEIQKYIANRLGVQYGTYTHFVTSLHIYDRDKTKVSKSILNYLNDEKVDVTIDGQLLLESAPDLYKIIGKIIDPKEAKKKAIELAKIRNIVGGKDIENQN